MSDPHILAFESSCDDTSIALVNSKGVVVLEKRFSQISLHKDYGGVVPELASRSHLEQIQGLYDFFKPLVVEKSISAVAATVGPGLMGALLVGANFAKGLAQGLNVPFIGVNHLRGHLASVLLTDQNTHQSTSVEVLPELSQKTCDIFPALTFLVSGGHTQLLKVSSQLQAELIAQSADDSAGECFDKTARLMGLDYPGGPAIEIKASLATPVEIIEAKKIANQMPVPKSEKGFSFSGLKTAIRLFLEKNPQLKESSTLAWAVQESISNALCVRLEKMYDYDQDMKSLIFCGGVSANKHIRTRLEKFAKGAELNFIVPPIKYCTDNAAMIAAAAWVQAEEFNVSDVKGRMPL